MSNPFYNPSGWPVTGSPGSSAPGRAELLLIAAGFDKFPTLTGNANKPLVVNSGGTAITVTTGTLALAGNFATTGAFNTTLAQTASTTVTLPASDTSVLVSAYGHTITGPTVARTLTVPDADGTLVTLDATQTLTNKTLTSPTLTTPALGTPASGTLTNCTDLPIATGVSGLATGVATLLATPSSANLAAAVTDETGSGALVFATSPTLVTPILGTPASGTLTNATGLPISTGVSGLAAGVATFLGTPTSANLAAAITNETGSGALVFGTSPTLATPTLTNPVVNAGSGTIVLPASTTPSQTAEGSIVWDSDSDLLTVGDGASRKTMVDTDTAQTLTNKTLTSPTLTTPALGTPASGTLTNATDLPIDAGTTGTLPVARGGTGVVTSTGTGNVVLSTSPTLVTPVLGTPASGTLTNATGLPIATGVSGLGTGVATFLATPSSANLAAAITNETGSGALVFGTSPTLATPTLTNPVVNAGSGTIVLPASATPAQTADGSIVWDSDSDLLTVGTGAARKTMVDTDTAQTLTNKTLTSPTLTTPALGAATAASLTLAAAGAIDWAAGSTSVGASIGANTLTLAGATSTVYIPGDLTVDGTTTTVNSATLAVTDPQVTVNVGGTDGTSEGAGLRVDRASTDGSLIYKDTSATKFAAGALAAEVDLVGTSSTQTLTNKTLTSPTLTTPVLGTPSSGTLTNCTGLPVNTGISGLATGVAAFLGTPTSANLITAVTDETGSGALVFGTSPTLGTPTLTNPVVNAGSGTIVLPASITPAQTAEGSVVWDSDNDLLTVGDGASRKTMVDTTTAQTLTNKTLTSPTLSSPTLTTPVLGTPSSGTLTSCTGLPIVAGTTGTLSVARGGTGVTTSTGSGDVVLSTSPTLVTPVLGTPASGTLTNATGLPISTGVSGLAAGVATFLATPSSANLAAAITNETGSGALVFGTSPTLATPTLTNPVVNAGSGTIVLPASTTPAQTAEGSVVWDSDNDLLTVGDGTSRKTMVDTTTAQTLTNKTLTSPTLTTPALGTPASGTLTNATGLPIVAGTTGTLSVARGGTGVTTSTGSGNVVLSTSPTLVTPILGTPTSATLTNATGLPISTGVSGLAAGVATFLATPSSANLISAVTDETGSGALVFGTSPTIATPTLTNPVVNAGSGTIVLPASTSPAQTADGSIVWDSDSDLLTVGTGAARKTMVDTDSTQTLTGKTLTSPTLTTPVLGTPSSGTLTSCTGLPISTGVSGLGTSVATFLATPSGANLATALTSALPTTKGGTGLTALGTGVATLLGTPTSANLAAAITDETGSGALVFGTSPTIASPTLSGTIAGTYTIGGTPTFPSSVALLNTEDQALTGGVIVTSKSLGTITTGTVTPDPGDRPQQHYTNGGAHTLAPSTNVGSILVDITNNASAGAITTSGFTKVVGDNFTTTDGDAFRCHISIGNAGSLLSIQSMQ